MTNTNINQFYLSNGQLVTGFGFNISTNQNAAKAALLAAGFGTNFTQTQWTQILSTAANPTSTSLSSLNTSMGTADTITQAQATTLSYV